MSQSIMQILTYLFLAADILIFIISVLSVLHNTLFEKVEEDARKTNAELFYIDRDITFTDAQGYID